jgi:hypothetical protein
MMRFRDITLGGEFAISYRIGFFAIPILIITVPLTSVAENTSGSFLTWTLAATIGTSVAVLALLVIDKTLWANRRIKPIPNDYLFIAGAALGALKGLITEITAHYLGVTGISAASIIERTVSSASIGTLAVPLIALMEFSLHAHKRLKIAKFNELAGINDLLDNLDNKDLEERFLSQVVSRVNQTKLEFIQKYVSNPDVTPEDIATYLNKVASELIRPLSHEAQKIDSHLKLARISIKEMIYRLPSAISIGLPWIMAVYVASSARVQLQLRGLSSGLLILLLDLLSLYVSIFVFLKVVKYGKYSISRIIKLFITALLAHSVISLIFAEIIFGNYKLNFALNIFWTALTIAEVSIASLFLTHELDELDRLEREYSTKFQTLLRFTQGQPRLAPTLARYLHGHMQSRLIASAFRIRVASSKEEIAKELLLVLENLELPADIADKVKVKTSLEIVSDLKELWEPFIELYLSEIEIKQLPIRTASEVCELLNEAISNAFRHGLASKVEVSITVSGNSCELKVRDNGEGLSTSSPGMGSEIFNKLTKSWNLERTGNHTEFRAIINSNANR